MSIRPRSRRVATRSLSASGSAAPSVMTYAMRASGRTDRTPIATAGSWLCSGVATTGNPSMLTRAPVPASRCSSVEPTSAWRLVYRSFMMCPGPGSTHSSRSRFQCTKCQPPVPRPRSTAVVLTITRSPGATGPVSCVSTYARLRSPSISTSTFCRPRRSSRRARTTTPVRNAGIGRTYPCAAPVADGRYSDAMRRSTRSSRALNGSLHSTVRWAWSLSFRCTQSTV